jgi:T-complex protein 1 subunit zeta
MQGYEHAKRATLAFLDSFKEEADPSDRELLRCVARTSLRTKLYEDLADQLTDIVVDAVLTIKKPDEAIDLFMVSLPGYPAWTDSPTALKSALPWAAAGAGQGTPG